jgi:hypothetical protein
MTSYIKLRQYEGEIGRRRFAEQRRKENLVKKVRG